MVNQDISCYRCNSDVLKNEQVFAAGYLFHKLCFLCSNPACHALLNSESYEQQNGRVYCKQCIKTWLYSDGLPPTAFQKPAYDQNETLSSASTAVALSSCMNERNSSLKNASYSIRRYDDSYSPPQTKVTPTQLDFSAHTAISPEDQMMLPSSIMSQSMVEGNSRPNADVLFAINRSSSMSKPSICHRCSKTVYIAEKMVAAGKIWHKLCFRCHDCGKSLEPGKFCDRNNEIYCNKCYARNFGPKGVGCGIGSGILQMHQ